MNQERATDAFDRTRLGDLASAVQTLGLAQQYEYTNALWNEIGYADRVPTADLIAWRRSRPELTTIWFARGAYDRALATLRDGDRLIGLPLINGGDGQHMISPYYPIPFSADLVSGVADSSLAQLMPQVRVSDGDKLAPSTTTATRRRQARLPQR